MGYSSERNVQILIGLMKYHGVKRIIVSPGATNVSFVASVQQDSYFELFSSVDERSAAYIACGMAAETGEPVALSCTGATASRNYLPGLTEAFYRKLPVLAITSTMPLTRIGHNIPQVIDRTNVINDSVKLSVCARMVKDAEDEWDCSVKINKALLELRHRMTGPVHINLETLQSGTFDVDKIANIRPIDRITVKDPFPRNAGGRIAVFCGAHKKWTDEETEEIDRFCENYNAVVLCDHTSNYRGKYGVLAALITFQKSYYSDCRNIDLLIHIGSISGAYISLKPKQVWRVDQEGEVCDTFRTLTKVYEMDEKTFFGTMNRLQTEKKGTSYSEKWQGEYAKMYEKIPELPFSNIYTAQYMSSLIPANSILHLGILNSLRSWNFFKTNNNIEVYSNTGGFGIDGATSTLMGAALARPDRLFIGVIGDLAFFYDMNVLGNRYFPSNVRLMVINNGMGQEFKNYSHRAAQFGDMTNDYIAAEGHFGHKSPDLVKDYAKDLGFEYMCAADKESFQREVKHFLQPENTERPFLFEVFTRSEEETEALKQMCNLLTDTKHNIASAVKNVIGEKGVKTLQKIIK